MWKNNSCQTVGRKENSDFYDLEDSTCALAPERAKTVLEQQQGLVVIDEIQLQPSLFSLLRVLADRKDSKTRFLILGSASPVIVKGVSETLAGRTALLEIGGFYLQELSEELQILHWNRGSFPRSLLAETEESSFRWRGNFVKTFLQRDIPQLGIKIAQERIQRFWTMVAHYHGNIWNAAEFAKSLGSTEKTVRGYLDILSGTYVVRQLQPWFENMGKRIVKAPKIYIRDSGLLHLLLGLENQRQLLSHPKLGYSWESYCMEQIIEILEAQSSSWFFATHAGAELDLMIIYGGKKYGFEFKYVDAPRTTRSMTMVMQDLKLEKLFVIYPGQEIFEIKENMIALPWRRILQMRDLL